MNDRKATFEIVKAIWLLFQNDMTIAPTITNAQDHRWVDMVARYEAIEKQAPPELAWYTGSMVLLHVDALERMWRK